MIWLAKKSAISPPAQAYITSQIRTLMFEYGKTGKIGKSKPKTRNAALRRAIAVSFSRAKQEGYKVPKKAEGLIVNTYKIRDSFIRNIYEANPKNINSRNSLKKGGERFNFSEGNISGYVLRKNHTSMDILISEFEGRGYFMESGEQIDSGEKLKGKVVLDIDNKLLTLDNDVWGDETTWSDSNNSSQQDSWQLDWDSEEYDLEKIVSMTNIEKIFIATALGLCIIVGHKK